MKKGRKPQQGGSKNHDEIDPPRWGLNYPALRRSLQTGL